MQYSSTHYCRCSNCTSSVRDSIRSYRERFSTPQNGKECSARDRAMAFIFFMVIVAITVLTVGAI